MRFITGLLEDHEFTASFFEHDWLLLRRDEYLFFPLGNGTN
jgi:hypothetical protein